MLPEKNIFHYTILGGIGYIIEIRIKVRSEIMKILSYNIYGAMNTIDPIPEWNIRQKNLEVILNVELNDNDIKVCCFQEVNKNNIKFLEDILTKNNFIMLEKFPMRTELYDQYNIIALKKDET